MFAHIITQSALTSALGSLYCEAVAEQWDLPLDVRLCIDGETWTLRSGDVSFDTYHSALCGAGELDGETILADLAADLLAQCEEQAAEIE
jgi:hypothetical protein